MGKQIVASQMFRGNKEGRCLGTVRLELEGVWEDEGGGSELWAHRQAENGALNCLASASNHLK